MPTTLKRNESINADITLRGAVRFSYKELSDKRMGKASEQD
jgi:hypothetical protein